jgi:sugar/nucleoside kinase (ribokinase family)
VVATHARVVCLDTVMIDFALIIDSLPARGGDALSSRRLMTAGGGYNVMSAARRQGVNALYVGQLGVGRFADIARGVLLNEGIHVALASRGDLDLGVCVVLVDQSGERTFVTSPGAELTLSAYELSTVSLVSGDVVYVSGYNVVYPEVARTVSEWLAALPTEVVVAFDPGPRASDIAPEIMARVIERTDWLLCNTAEAQLWVSSDDALDCASELRGRAQHSMVVVRDGANGCAAASAQGLVRAPGFAAHVVDTNGAGDVHNGVVIAELMMGTSLEEALLRANAAASIAIASFGPATCPTRNLVDELMLAQPREVAGR